MNAFEGKNIHFMGAGGIGVSALAGIAIARGAKVSGCDREENEQTKLLRQLGAKIFIGHSPEHLLGCDQLVYTSAIHPQHPELLAAGGRGVKRGDFLARLVSAARGIGVSGTHGKTTTTWLLGRILLHAGLDPTIFVGGVVPELGGNYRCGGELFVTELDESDGSFLKPDLELAVITNIESEHLAHYGTLEKVVESFAEFAEKGDTPGFLVANLDCPLTRPLYERRRGRKVGFGLQDRSGLHACNIICVNGGQEADICRGDAGFGRLRLPFYGVHNIYNALAALAAADALGVEPERALEGLAGCCGVGRRMERIGRFCGVDAYTDYAHHPGEVAAAIAGARQMAAGRLLVVFQPHLYSRTRDYAPEFALALALADGVYLCDIYPAREEPLPGISSEVIARDIPAHALVGCGGIDDIAGDLCDRAGGYGLIIFMGAGDIEKAGRMLCGKAGRYDS